MALTIFPIVCDESVDLVVFKVLQQFGFPITSITLEHSGVSDTEVLRIAESKKALVLTADKDFGHLVVRLKLATAGIILLRLPGIHPDLRAERVLEIFGQHSHLLLGSFSVVQARAVRIRPLGGCKPKPDFFLSAPI